ncbi:3-oxoacyl-ACP reductase [Litoribrevibacter albus]|uniref:3-oxoacyl-ACP reductase n=1 Tax=Litoribrevibacter albus TaxID=1473156 RepID=A0AA37W648_9GAMM|nr:3-oxoacyl-ACP reductase [Litoribrevibacter albus]GLQ31225.1 3-oxoacyl-ACP reductase [Litoribrevibacter albus]
MPQGHVQKAIKNFSQFQKSATKGDVYQNVVNHPWAQPLVKALNLPVPVKLRRQQQASEEFLRGKALFGAASTGNKTESDVSKAILSVLAKSSAKLFFVNGDKQQQDLMNASKSYPLRALSETTQKHSALVYDATSIETPEQLSALYDFYHNAITRIAEHARIVVIGLPPENCKTPAQASVMRSLEGFIRSCAKEIGGKAATANLLLIEPEAEALLESPLRYLLSARGAFVTGQTLTITKVSPTKDSINWRQPLQDKTALITGASRGIGKAIAETLARDGAKVILLDIEPCKDDLEALARRLGGHAVIADVSDKKALNKLIKDVQKGAKTIDILVNNAGITRDKTLARMDDKRWNSVIDINLSAVQRITEALVDNKVLNVGGRVVCISSINGIAGCFGQTNYSTSKAGVIGYVEAMDKVLARRRITINAIAPGFIETQMTQAIPFLSREIGRRINSLSQGGQPEDVAEAVAMFANPASSGLRANTLRVCGQNLVGA